jgi:hypothetical protein
MNGYFYNSTQHRSTFLWQTVFLISLIGILNSCGTDPEKSKAFRNEKHQRLEAEKKLSESNATLEQRNKFLNSAITTTNYIWIFRHEAAFNTEQAAEECKSVGFELPSDDMLREAEGNPTLKQHMLWVNGDKLVYSTNVSSKSWKVVLMCAKKR